MLPLLKHQKESIKFGSTRTIMLDASDPGTGKTRVQLELFAARRKKGGGCALVMGTKGLLKSAWDDDRNKFTPHLRASIARAENRGPAFEADADIYLTNHDAAKWLMKQKPAFFKKFDTLIVDESTFFKHHTSQRTKAINKVKQHFKYRSILTGTLNANTVADVWSQIYILDDGERLGRSYYAFRASVCQPTQVGPSPNMVRWEDRPGAEAAVGSLLRDITIRHKFEECTDIPENHQYSVPFVMTSKHSKLYKEMEKTAVLQLNGGAVTAINAAAVYTKLLQIASGAVYETEEKYHLLDTDRYDLILDMVQERENSLVFFNWKHQRDELMKNAEARGLTFCLLDGSVSNKQREQAVEYFQNGFYRVLFAHPQSAAHGVTLTRGTTTIWASPTSNLELFAQGNKRIYRTGQKKKTETIITLAENTIEQRVYGLLQKRDVRMSDMLSILKEAA